MEIWKDVLGWEGLYRVNKRGQIQSLPKSRRHSSKIIKPRMTRGAKYPRVRLSRNGKTSDVFLHRIVALAFVENTDDKPWVNHKNGNKLDYRIENLEWCTDRENKIHAYQHGLNKKPPTRRGSEGNSAKLHETDIPKIRESLLLGDSLSSVARTYGVSLTCIARIRDKLTWLHVN